MNGTVGEDGIIVGVLEVGVEKFIVGVAVAVEVLGGSSLVVLTVAVRLGVGVKVKVRVEVRVGVRVGKISSLVMM